MHACMHVSCVHVRMTWMHLHCMHVQRVCSMPFLLCMFACMAHIPTHACTYRRLCICRHAWVHATHGIMDVHIGYVWFTYMHTRVPLCYVCMHVPVDACMRMCVHGMHVRMCMHVIEACLCACMYADLFIYLCMHVCVCIYLGKITKRRLTKL
jgi:hypothetical protein